MEDIIAVSGFCVNSRRIKVSKKLKRLRSARISNVTTILKTGKNFVPLRPGAILLTYERLAVNLFE